MLELKNITKSYGRSMALNGLNMYVPKGGIYGFIGPNGAGKTTTMKIISGILPADSGELYFNGNKAMNDYQCLKNKIGYMPDFFGVYDNLTVIEYMEFFCSLYYINKKEMQKRNEELLELVNLGGKKDELVDTLSRGMKQRLCLARAMVHEPDLLVLDEPASGMEPRARLEMKNILKRLSEEGRTIIISSHVLSEVSELCDSIGVVIKGEMVLQGDTEAVIFKHKSMQQVIIHVLGDAEPITALLKKHPLVSNIAIERHDMNQGIAYRISIQFYGKEEEEAELLHQLVYAGIQVVAFKREERDLETVFFELTEDGSEDNQSGV